MSKSKYNNYNIFITRYPYPLPPNTKNIRDDFLSILALFVPMLKLCIGYSNSDLFSFSI